MFVDIGLTIKDLSYPSSQGDKLAQVLGDSDTPKEGNRFYCEQWMFGAMHDAQVNYPQMADENVETRRFGDTSSIQGLGPQVASQHDGHNMFEQTISKHWAM